MNFPKSLRSIEVEQKSEYGFTLDAVKKLLDGFEAVKKYAYIQHGRPIEDKDDHVHLLLWFKYPYPTELLIKRLTDTGIQAGIQQLEKIKKEDSAVAYLTHENVDKPKYDRGGIYTNIDADEIKKSIDKAVSRKALRRDPDRAVELTNSIVRGDIRLYNLHEYVDAVEYNIYNKDIKLAFEYRMSMLLGEKERHMECLFITGKSGTGKSTYAKKVAADKGYSFFVSSGSNDPLDGYRGEDCIILDDLRGSTMKMSDLLKMLDNHTQSSVTSRYRNKVIECKMMIITTVYDLDTFFSKVFEHDGEPVTQLKRRCGLLLHFYPEKIGMYVYDKKKQTHVYVGDMPNPVADMYKAESMTTEQALDYISQTLGMAADAIKKAKPVIIDNEQVDRDIMTMSKEEYAQYYLDMKKSKVSP